MKLFDVLKQSGLFSNDIKLRIKNNQITVNSDVIKDNIDLDIETEFDKENKEIAVITDADDFLFWTLMKNKNSDISTQFKIFGFENLFGSNVKNDLTDILNDFIFVRTSKKETFLLKKAR